MLRFFATLFLWGVMILWNHPAFCESSTLTLGVFSQEPKNEVKRLDPLIHYIVENLQNSPVTLGKIRVERNISKMIAASRERKVDLFMGGPLVSYLLKNSGEFDLLLQISTFETDKHSALFLVTQKSPIKTIKDLRGNTLAFESPLSSIGYFMPKMLLQEKGYKLVPKKKTLTPLPSEEITYLFSGSDENTLLWLIKGKVEAGVVSSEHFKRRPKEITQEFRIIEKTVPVPPLLLSYRSNLSPDLVKQIKNILKKMHQDEKGRKILENLYQTSRFQDIPKSTLDFLQKKKDFIQKEVKY